MDIAQARIAGPQKITYGAIDLGHTTGGVLLTAERDFADVTVDKFGPGTPIDKILTGNRALINFTLAQTSYRQIDAVLPETSSVDGSAADRINLGADAGVSLRERALELRIHPLRLADSDQSEDVVLYLAASVENVELPFRVDEQKVIEVTMQAFPVETYDSGRRLGHIGPAVVS